MCASPAIFVSTQCPPYPEFPGTGFVAEGKGDVGDASDPCAAAFMAFDEGDAGSCIPEGDAGDAGGDATAQDAMACEGDATTADAGAMAADAMADVADGITGDGTTQDGSSGP
jgi:hypothetical protein